MFPSGKQSVSIGETLCRNRAHDVRAVVLREFKAVKKSQKAYKNVKKDVNLRSKVTFGDVR